MPLEGQFLVSDGKVSVVDDLGSDVHPVFNLEVDEVRLSVFDFVESWLLRGVTLDVGESLVVIDD